MNGAVRDVRCGTRVAAVAAAVALAAGVACASVSLTSQAQRGPVRLLLTAPPRALVIEQRAIQLAPGTNRVTVQWDRARVDRASVFLRAPEAGADVDLSGAIFPRGMDNAVCWDVATTTGQPVTLEALYRLDGLTWAPEYRIEMAPGAEQGLFRATALLANNTGDDLPSAGYFVGNQCIGERPLVNGETVKLEFLENTALPLAPQVVFDASRYGNAVVLRARLANTTESGLGCEALYRGKVRTYLHNAEGILALSGEDELPDLPLGSTADVFLCYQDDLRAARTESPSTDVNVRRDSRGRTVVYDSDQTRRIEFENPRPEPVTIRVIEHADGQWQIGRSTHAYTRVDATTLEFTVDVPAAGEANGKAALEYRLRRQNLAP